MHLVLDTVLCCHPLYCFAAATSSVWVFQINDQQVKWTPPVQNVYRSVTNGWVTTHQEARNGYRYRALFECSALLSDKDSFRSGVSTAE